MNTRFFMILTLVNLILSAGTVQAGPIPEKPNFVVIFIDDMGYGDIGPFGSTINETPHLDRMAAEHPEVVRRLDGYMDQFEAEIRKNARPVGVAKAPRTLLPRPDVQGEKAFTPTLELK